MSSRFPSNSEANASKLLTNHEEIFFRCYVYSDVINRFKSSITHWCVTRCERVENQENEYFLIEHMFYCYISYPHVAVGETVHIYLIKSLTLLYQVLVI